MTPPFFYFEIHQKKKIRKKELYIYIYRLLNISLLLNNREEEGVAPKPIALVQGQLQLMSVQTISSF
jgi:hypothetical protein